MRTLETLAIRNFKSIRDQTLRLGALNIFIGGNGSGKSNLIEVFRFLREIVEQRLAMYWASSSLTHTALPSPSCAVRDRRVRSHPRETTSRLAGW